MALGNLYFDVLLNDKTDQGINAIKSKLSKLGVEVGTDIAKGIEAQLKNIKLSGLNASNLNVKATLNVDKNKILTDIQDALSKKQFTIDIKAKSNITTNANKSALAYETEAQAKLINSQARLLQAQNAQAVSEQKAALAQVKLARQKQMLANATNRATQSARNYTNANRGVIGSLREMTGLAGKFSAIYMGWQFLSSLIKIRGEFEMQLVSLRAILQSTERANELYGQLQQLSVISPFQFGDLVKYAKQLSAYQIPTQDLYDTTKRLADLSAGLGVDINRLILAYGQVKSAAVLRGTELRQFTEAGIPMVGALADKFSELEGRVVSAGEVFDKISNREVPFQMVKEVLEDLTSEGGMFFEMQEKQAQTLQGQISNLKDAYAIMMNEIGKSQDGLLKTGVGAIRWSLQNYEELLSILLSVVAAYGAYRIQLGYKTSIMGKDTQATLTNALAEKQRKAEALKATALTRQLTAQEQRLIATKGKLTKTDYARLISLEQLNALDVKRLYLLGRINDAEFRFFASQVGIQQSVIQTTLNMNMLQRAMTRVELATTKVVGAFINLGKILKANWVTLVVGGIVDLISWLTNLGDINEELNERMRESATQTISDIDSFFNSHQVTLTGIENKTISNEEAKKFIEKASEKIMQVAPTTDLAIGIKAELELENDTTAKAKKLVDVLENIRSASDAINASLVAFEFTEDGWLGGLLGGEGFESDTKDLSKEVADLQEVVREYAKAGTTIGEVVDFYRNNSDLKPSELAKKIGEMFGNGSEGAGEELKQAVMQYQSDWEEAQGELQRTIATTQASIAGRTVEEQRVIIAQGVQTLKDKIKDLNPFAQLGLISKFESTFGQVDAQYEALTTEIISKNRKTLQNWAGDYSGANSKVLKEMVEKAIKGLNLIGLKAEDVVKNINKLEAIINVKINVDTSGNSKIQEAIENALSSFVGSKADYDKLVNLFAGETDYSKIKSIIQENYEKTKKEIEALEELGNLNSEQQKQLNSAKNLHTNLKNVSQGLGVSPVKPTKTSQVDQAAKALQDQYKELKKLYDEWEKLSKLIGNENAKAKLAEMSGFKELFEDANLADLINKMLTDGGDLVLVKEYLEKVKGMTSKEALSFVETLEQALRSIQIKDLTESVSKAIEQINDALDVNIKKYQEWEKYYESTGNKSIASLLAYSDANAIAKSEAQLRKENVAKVADTINGEYKGLTYEILLTYDKDKLDKLPKALQETFKEAQDAVDSEASEINAKLIESYKNTMSIDELVKALEEERDKLLQSTTDATLKKSVIDDYAKKIGELKAKALELLPVWERIFGDSFSYGGIKEAMGYARQLIDNATPTTKNADGSMNYLSSFIDANGVKQEVTIVSDQLKDLKKQYGELFDSLAEKNPFKAFVASMRELTTESRSLSNDRAWRGVLNSLSGIFKMGAELSGSMKTIFDATGLENVGNAMNTAMILLEGTSNIAQAYAQGDDMGAMVASAQLLANTIADAKWRSSADEEEAIEELEGKIRGYQSARELLENSLRRELGIYGEDGVKSMEKYAEIVKTYEEEIAAREAQLAEEKNKKESDQDATAIADYEAEIEKLNETVRYFAEDTLKDLMGIDLKEWASNFGDALVEAFASGEDAASAFDKTVADLMKNVVKNMASLYILEPALKELQTYLFGADGNGGVFGSDKHFSEEDLAGMKPYLDRLEKEAIPAVEDLFEAIDTAMGGVLSSSSNLEGLSGGIKSITEDTANLLASYLNAVRADVALIAMGSPRMTTIAEAQLAQLNVIATNTSRSAVAVEAINTLLKSVTTTTSSGRVLKV